MSSHQVKRHLKEDQIKIIELIVGVLTLVTAILGYTKIIGDENTIAFLALYLAGLALALIYAGLTKPICVLCFKRKPVFWRNILTDRLGKNVSICSEHYRLLRCEYAKFGRMKSVTTYDGEKFLIPDDSKLRS